MNSIKLGNKIIDDNSLYFIADIGANHNGSLEKAIELIHLAKESGADAAKFQNFQADKIVSKLDFDFSSNNTQWGIHNDVVFDTLFNDPNKEETPFSIPYST